MALQARIFDIEGKVRVHPFRGGIEWHSIDLLLPKWNTPGVPRIWSLGHNVPRVVKTIYLLIGKLDRVPREMNVCFG